jgi:hypothetical protein
LKQINNANTGGAYIEAAYKDLNWVKRAMQFYATGAGAVHRCEHDLYKARLVLSACKAAGTFDGTLGSAIVVLSGAGFKIVA